MTDHDVREITGKMNQMTDALHTIDMRLTRMEESLCGRQAVCADLLKEIRTQIAAHDKTLHGDEGVIIQLDRLRNIIRYSRYHLVAMWTIISGVVIRIAYAIIMKE